VWLSYRWNSPYAVTHSSSCANLWHDSSDSALNIGSQICCKKCATALWHHILHLFSLWCDLIAICSALFGQFFYAHVAHLQSYQKLYIYQHVTCFSVESFVTQCTSKQFVWRNHQMFVCEIWDGDRSQIYFTLCAEYVYVHKCVHVQAFTNMRMWPYEFERHDNCEAGTICMRGRAVPMQH